MLFHTVRKRVSAISAARVKVYVQILAPPGQKTSFAPRSHEIAQHGLTSGRIFLYSSLASVATAEVQTKTL